MLCLLLRVAAQLAGQRADAPLAALLTGAELIVSKGQEWELNAPLSLQLGSALSGISGLVARWRKLELASWGQLLLDEEAQAQAGEGVAELFLALRELLRAAPAEAELQAQAEQHMAQAEQE